MNQLAIAQDFTQTPGARYRREGSFSGEQFLSELLYPRFAEAVGSGSVLTVVLDGTAGYATSFLEASFGGLIRGNSENGNAVPAHTYDIVNRHLNLVSSDPYLVEEIDEYMREAAEFPMAVS